MGLEAVGGVPQYPSKTVLQSQVELRELFAHCVADQVADEAGDVPARAADHLLVLLGYEAAEVGQPGGDGKPDAVYQGGEGGEGPADDGVYSEDDAAEGDEEGADGFAQRVCPGFEKRSANRQLKGRRNVKGGGS